MPNGGMTPAQETLIVTLAAKVTGSYMRNVEDAHPLLPASRSSIRRGLTKAEASQCIDALQNQLSDKEKLAVKLEETPAAAGTMTAEQILSTLGRHVEIVYELDGVEKTYAGKVLWISPSSKDGSPALEIRAADGGGSSRTVRTCLIKEWKVVF